MNFPRAPEGALGFSNEVERLMRKTNYDLVIDVESPLSRNIVFYPAAMSFRSTLRALPGDHTGIIDRVDKEIPGHRLLINTKARSITLIDRMSLPENAEKAKTIRKLAQNERYWYIGELESEPDVEFPNLSHRKWLQWLYHLRIHVDAGKFRIVSGSLPLKAEILSMCDWRNGLRIQLGDSCGVKFDKDERPFYMVDERDIPAMQVTGAED